MRKIADTPSYGRALPTPALDQLNRELERGERRVNTFDPLWCSGCWEKSALEAYCTGNLDGAKRDLAHARQILADALQTTS